MLRSQQRQEAETNESNTGLLKGSEIEPWPPDGDGVAGRLTSACRAPSFTESSGFSRPDPIGAGVLAPFHYSDKGLVPF